MKNIFCCILFENLINNAGERGLAAIVWFPIEGITFFLQSRGIAFLDEGKMTPVDLELIVNISTEIAMKYCPFCGKRLKDLANASPKEFMELALDHKRFLSLNFL